MLLSRRQHQVQSAMHFLTGVQAAGRAQPMTQRTEPTTGQTKDETAVCNSATASNDEKSQASTKIVNASQMPLLLRNFQQKLSFTKNPEFHASEHNAEAIGKQKYSKRFFEYIEEVTHMDEVRMAQAQVMEIKNQLRNAGNRKRNILKQLEITRSDLNQIYKEMKFTNNRASGHYLELVKQEVELYSKEHHLQEDFIEADEQEQHLFNAFSAAINDSYEKEKLHTSFIKVLGIIGTIFGTFLTMILSVVGQINHSNKFYTLRGDFEKTLSTQFKKNIDELNKRLLPLERQHNRTTPESWGSYLKRNTRWMYGWAVPKN